MNYVAQMAFLRDRIAAIAPIFGSPNIKEVFICQKLNSGIVKQPIQPQPFVQEVKYDLESFPDISSLKGMSRVFEIKGVSKKYPRIELEQANEYEVKGIRCQLIEIKEESLSWLLRVEEKIGQRQFYGNQ